MTIHEEYFRSCPTDVPWVEPWCNGCQDETDFVVQGNRCKYCAPTCEEVGCSNYRDIRYAFCEVHSHPSLYCDHLVVQTVSVSVGSGCWTHEEVPKCLHCLGHVCNNLEE